MNIFLKAVTVVACIGKSVYFRIYLSQPSKTPIIFPPFLVLPYHSFINSTRLYSSNLLIALNSNWFFSIKDAFIIQKKKMAARPFALTAKYYILYTFSTCVYMRF